MARKIAFTIAAMIFAGLIFLYIEGREAREFSTYVEVSVPPEEVWSVLANINQWHEWSPIINKSSGSAKLGETLDITMTANEQGDDGPQYYPEIIQLEAPKLLVWRATMLAGFVFTNDKVLELQATPDGTKVIHKELFSGLLVPILSKQMAIGVPPMLDAMNAALKDRVER